MYLTSVRLVNFAAFPDTEEIPLGRVNVLVGRNNAGKSLVLRALHGFQDGTNVGVPDIRKGATELRVEAVIEDPPVGFDVPLWPTIGISYTANVEGQVIRQARDASPNGSGTSTWSGFATQEPGAVIYPLFNRRPDVYEHTIAAPQSNRVGSDWRNLAARLDRLLSHQNPRSNAVAEALESVLGIPLSTVPSEHGKQPGIFTDPTSGIYLDRMGAGVANAATLISCLVGESGKLFLIEEPETDLHPAALRSLLAIISTLAERNQFVISTHSHVALRYLASLPEAKTFFVEQEPFRPDTSTGVGVPTSTIHAVPEGVESRRTLLSHLGYELSDLDLWDAWLILEESSAERIIRQYLVKWFVPSLIGRLCTVSAAGISKIAPSFEDFRRLFLFIHREEVYRARAWVVVDGDDKGKACVEAMRARYQTWAPEHFRHWSVDAFERFYPEPFAARYDAEVERLSGDQKREAKKKLLDEVLAWIEEDDVAARTAFEMSCREVIQLLQEVEQSLA